MLLVFVERCGRSDNVAPNIAAAIAKPAEKA